jgi:hypothetical protein
MKKSRLQKMVNHLYKVGSDIAAGKMVDKFDMSTWGELEEPGKFKNRKDMSCMTAACAIGHAGFIFKSEGFKLQIDGEQEDYGGDFVEPYYKGLTGIDAVAKFFDISIDDVEYLFMPESYIKFNSLGQAITNYRPGPGAVADRIRAFMEE